jgi:hypothetical protein
LVKWGNNTLNINPIYQKILNVTFIIFGIILFLVLFIKDYFKDKTRNKMIIEILDVCIENIEKKD